MNTAPHLVSSYVVLKSLLLILTVFALLLGAYYFLFVTLQVSAPRVEPSRAQEVLRKASDVALAGRVKSAFTLSNRLAGCEIGVEVKDGLVTITGQVPSEIEKDLAAGLAAEVAGVRQINNRIEVNAGLVPYSPEGGALEYNRLEDLETRADLRARLSALPGLRPDDIQIIVRNHTVTLQGYVRTEALRERAERAVRELPKVAVVINQLRVGQLRVGQLRVGQLQVGATSGQELPISSDAARDRELTLGVSAALSANRDNFSPSSTIKADCTNGTVRLTGTVTSRAERALAERIAREVPGVKSISNQMSISDHP